MDPLQFEQIIQALTKINDTLGREPATNFWTLGTILSLASFLVAGLAYLNSVKSSAFEMAKQEYEKKSRDAEFVFSSFREYTELLDHLVSAREVYEDHREQFKKLDNPDFSEASLRSVEEVFSPDTWKSVREVKRFYKSRFELVRNGYVTKEAAFFAVDNMGIDLLFNEVKRMDTQRFMENRMKSLKRGDVNVNEIPAEYERVFQWYADAKSVVGSKVGTYGQRTIDA